MNSNRSNASYLRGVATAALAIGMLAATPALWAQDNAAPAPVSPAPVSTATPAPHADASADTPDDTKDIVVTGSRLQNPGFSAPTPVSVVSSARIEQRSPANIADVVNQIPAFRLTRGEQRRATINAPGGTAITTGVQSLLDLRGLGEQRTLVLINGQRVTPTNYSNTFDTNMIPVGLVERVEVVTGGASAAYGSDAVAGVANFILRNRMEGISGSIQTGITRYGDGRQVTATIAAGTSFAGGRGHFIIGADYNRSQAVGNIYSRPFGRLEPGTVSRSPRPADEPATVYANNVERSDATPGGLISTALGGNFYSFDAAGNPVVFNRGTLYGIYMLGSTANYGNRTDISPLRSPNNRQVGYARAEYEASEAITLFAEASLGRTAAQPYVIDTFVSNYTLSRTDPRLPTSIRALIPATQATVTLGRLNQDFGGQTTRQDNVAKRGVIGANGEIGGGWKWNAYYQYGETLQHLYAQGLSQPALTKITNGCSETGLDAASLASVRAYEQLTGKSCAGLTFNPVGTGAGNSAAAYNYFLQEQLQTSKMKLQVASAGITGSPFSIGDRPVSVATGVEWRKEFLDAKGRFPYQLNLFTTGNFADFGGTNTVKEIFAEVGVPLLRDLPLIHALDLNGAVRRTDYATSGTVTTWKLGATYEPVRGLRLRATRSRDIRAASLRDLFYIASQTNLTITNTLPIGTVGANGTVSTRTGSRAPVINQNRGNPNLVPEVANTFTAGAVVELGRLRASVDYYDIKLDKAIATPSPQNIIDQCRLGAQSYCQTIIFDNSAVGISFIGGPLSNLNTLRNTGIDFVAQYSLAEPMGLPGTFDFNLTVNHQIHASEYSPLTGQTTENAGTIAASPRWGGFFNVNYRLQPITFSVELQGFNGFKNSAISIGPEDEGYSPALVNSVSTNRSPGVLYTNIGMQFEATRNFTFFLNVDNLFNVAPPPLTNSFLYDAVGQRFRVGVRGRL